MSALLATAFSATSRRASIRCLRPRVASVVRSPHQANSMVRFMSASSSRSMSQTTTSKKDIGDLKVSQARLMEDLHFTCSWGVGQVYEAGPDKTKTGMSRLALSDADKDVRDWFVQTTQELGCQTTVDAIGNIFAVRPGRNAGPATFAGSHLDTQPTGGRYDGILGIHAGIEMLKVLHENDMETEFPVGVVNWTNEEGARFPISMVASGVWAGAIPLERAYALNGVRDGKNMKAELSRIGYLGSTPASHEATPMAAHFELHIEQGPILETEGKKVGVVQGVQAYRWFTIEVAGADCHTGTTPFPNRADALLAASKMVVLSHRLATSHSALASTGIMTVAPGSTNTVPGSVSFSLDIRASTDATLDALEEELRQGFAGLAAGENVAGLSDGGTPGKQCQVSWQTDFVSPAVRFHDDCIGCVRQAAESVFPGGDMARDLVSGAGHDSVFASRRCPTSMIFVPCKDGVSHNPKEFTAPEDCAVGAEVLMKSVLNYDRLRAEGKAEEGQSDLK